MTMDLVGLPVGLSMINVRLCRYLILLAIRYIRPNTNYGKKDRGCGCSPEQDLATTLTDSGY